MYDLLKNIYPVDHDPRVDYLSDLEKDCRTREAMLERRAEIYDEIQNILNADSPSAEKLALVEIKIEALKNIVL